LPPSLTGLDFSGYQTAGATIVNDCNHYTIEVFVAPGTSTLNFNGHTYKLVRFHFHEPAENIINGSSPLAMEVHLVHEEVGNPDAKLVVAVLVRPGAENGLIRTLWAHIPPPGQTVPVSIPINARDLLPVNKAYYNFTGSLTTPPCTPGLTWIVFKDPAQFSALQIGSYTTHYHGTARRLQPVIRQSH
jgi:carbonic anhydrase